MGILTRAVRNISRRKMRALLVIVALGFSMAIMVSVPAGIVANQQATQNLTANFNKTVSNMQEEINKTLTLIECRLSSGSTQEMSPSGPMRPPGSGTESYMNESILTDFQSTEGVKDIVPILQKSEGTNETVERFGRTFTFLRPDYTIIGVPLNSSLINSYSILPTNITDGRNLQGGDSGVVLLSENNTAYFGVGVGEKVTIRGVEFTVVGIHSSSDFMENRNLYMNISDAQAISNLTGKISRIEVYTESSDVVDEVASRLSLLYPELSITTYKDRLKQLQSMQSMYTETLSSAQSTVDQTQAIATQEIGIAVVATCLITLFVMLYTVRERTREIGTLKAIGFSGWNVMSQFMAEGIVISFAAGLVGILIGIIGAPILSGFLLPHINLFGGSPQSSFRLGRQTTNVGSATVASAAPNLQIMLLALGLAVLLGALGSLYPAWRASRTRPAEAMRYE